MPNRSDILAAIESLKDHETGSPIDEIRRHIRNNTIGSDSDDSSSWNELRFQKTLKTLVEKGDLFLINGVNYKFSNQFLQRRAEALRERAESIEEQKHKTAVEHHHAREMTPKEAPKKKTLHAKVKINEGEIITVVNPPDVHHEDDMDVSNHEYIIAPVGGDGVTTQTTAAKNKKHVKIIPRKVGAAVTKNMR